MAGGLFLGPPTETILGSKSQASDGHASSVKIGSKHVGRANHATLGLKSQANDNHASSVKIGSKLFTPNGVTAVSLGLQPQASRMKAASLQGALFHHTIGLAHRQADEPDRPP